MRTRDGAHELDAAGYCSRTKPLFEAGSETYAPAERIDAVAAGRRTKGGVGYNIFQVL
jgi:hypothetical protein